MRDADSEQTRQQRIQRQLDEALADSFPASDPVSIVTSQQEEDWVDAPDKAAGSSSPTRPDEPRKP